LEYVADCGRQFYPAALHRPMRKQGGVKMTRKLSSFIQRT
jgi:hypothetical protein